jgi:hypothetical protein
LFSFKTFQTAQTKLNERLPLESSPERQFSIEIRPTGASLLWREFQSGDTFSRAMGNVLT